MICKIKKKQKPELLKLIDKIADGKPYLFHERELSKDEVEIIIIATSFTPSQIEQLEKADLSSFKVVKKMEFEKTISFEMPMKKRT